METPKLLIPSQPGCPFYFLKVSTKHNFLPEIDLRHTLPSPHLTPMPPWNTLAFPLGLGNLVLTLALSLTSSVSWNHHLRPHRLTFQMKCRTDQWFLNLLDCNPQKNNLRHCRSAHIHKANKSFTNALGLLRMMHLFILCYFLILKILVKAY